VLIRAELRRRTWGCRDAVQRGGMKGLVVQEQEVVDRVCGCCWRWRFVRVGVRGGRRRCGGGICSELRRRTGLLAGEG
jgi:hypothetical protein